MSGDFVFGFCGCDWLGEGEDAVAVQGVGVAAA